MSTSLATRYDNHHAKTGDAMAYLEAGRANGRVVIKIR
jgi:hypothetical protein